MDIFGPIAPLLPRVLSPLAAWIEKSTIEVWRIAIGAVVVSPVQSRAAGYDEIVSMTKSLALDTKRDLSDLFFQINRPAPSAVIKGLTINRLMRFSVSAMKMFTLSGDATAEAGSIDHYTRLETDVNTAVPPPEDKPLEKAKIGAIFKELSDVTLKLNSEGEP